MRRNLIILSFFALCHTFLNAQIVLEVASLTSAKKEKSKTLFVYRDSDKEDLENLTKVIQSNWKYNKIELVHHKEFKPTDLKNEDLVFLIDYTYNAHRMGTIEKPESGPVLNHVDFYLTLQQKSAKGLSLIATAQLTISGQTIFDVCKSSKKPAEIIANQYTTYDILNWNYAYIAIIVKTISDKLPLGKDYSTVENKVFNLGELKTATLLVSDQVNRDFSTMNGKEKFEDKKEDIDKEYNYAFEMASNEKINEMILAGEEGYLLQFQKKGDGNYVIIIDMKNLDIIFHEVHYNRFNFDPGYMKAIGKSIEGKKK